MRRAAGLLVLALAGCGGPGPTASAPRPLPDPTPPPVVFEEAAVRGALLDTGVLPGLTLRPERIAGPPRTTALTLCDAPGPPPAAGERRLLGGGDTGVEQVAVVLPDEAAAQGLLEAVAVDGRRPAGQRRGAAPGDPARRAGRPPAGGAHRPGPPGRHAPTPTDRDDPGSRSHGVTLGAWAATEQA